MTNKKLKVFLAGGVLSFICMSSDAAGENDLWEGLYLQTSGGKNIEFKHSHVPQNNRKARNGERVSCLVDAPEKDFNFIKNISAKEVRSVFFKPTAKYAAQMYELRQVEVKMVFEDNYETKYCYEKNDLLPKSRNLLGGTQFQVSPELQAGRFYIIEKDYSTMSALIKFSK